MSILFFQSKFKPRSSSSSSRNGWRLDIQSLKRVFGIINTDIVDDKSGSQ
jgi:hypothetical protein